VEEELGLAQNATRILSYAPALGESSLAQLSFGADRLGIDCALEDLIVAGILIAVEPTALLDSFDGLLASLKAVRLASLCILGENSGSSPSPIVVAAKNHIKHA
jgi:hypothetical protein